MLGIRNWLRCGFNGILCPAEQVDKNNQSNKSRCLRTDIKFTFLRGHGVILGSGMGGWIEPSGAVPNFNFHWRTRVCVSFACRSRRLLNYFWNLIWSDLCICCVYAFCSKHLWNGRESCNFQVGHWWVAINTKISLGSLKRGLNKHA